MLCCVEKQKNAEGKDVARNLFRHFWEIFATPWRYPYHPLEEILKPPLPAILCYIYSMYGAQFEIDLDTYRMK